MLGESRNRQPRKFLCGQPADEHEILVPAHSADQGAFRDPSRRKCELNSIFNGFQEIRTNLQTI